MSDHRQAGIIPFRKGMLSAGVIHIIASHESLRRSLAMLLRSFSATALPFATAADFFRHLAKPVSGRPACVIVDLYQLDLPIAALLDRLDLEADPLPVLLLKGGATPRERRIVTGRRSLIDSLIKPYKPQALLSTLDRLLADPASPGGTLR